MTNTRTLARVVSPSLSQLVTAVRAGLCDPRNLLDGARSAGAAILDMDFDRNSRIAELPAMLLRRICNHEVVLPPTSAMLPGNQSVEGLIFLVSLAKSLKASRCFEIGTYNGLTAWCLARNLENAMIDTLDLPAEETTALRLGPLDSLNRLRFSEPVYSALPVKSEVMQHWGDSARFDFAQFHGECDLVYVDGAHSREYVQSDTRNALEMLSARGTIVWDDYWRRVPEVHSVLDDMRDLLSLYRIPGTRLVVHFTVGATSLLEDEVILSQR